MSTSTRISRLSVIAVLSALLLGAVAPAASAGPITDRRAMFRETNESRLDVDVRRLDLAARLSKLAKRHSARMARSGALFHTSDPAGYYLKGRRWSWWGENVGMAPSGSVPELHRAFMRSTPHRSNILNGRFTRVAIGAVRRDGTLWVTVFFYRP